MLNQTHNLVRLYISVSFISVWNLIYYKFKRKIQLKLNLKIIILVKILNLEFLDLFPQWLCGWSSFAFSRSVRFEDSTNFCITGNWNWSLSIIIWSIRIVCQKGQDFHNFCIPMQCCNINWSVSILIWSIRIVW